MQLEVGQVYQRFDAPTEYVLVIEVRDEEHPRGLGQDGVSAIAMPIDPRQQTYEIAEAHPFDVQILCPTLEKHGAQRWRHVEHVMYLLREDGLMRPGHTERRRAMNEVCMCGHAADEHEDTGLGLCTVIGCPCAGFDADEEPDVES